MDINSMQKSVETGGRYYPVIMQTEEMGGFFVTCPIFDGCFSQGETIEQALSNIREVIHLCAEEMTPAHVPQVSMHQVQI